MATPKAKDLYETDFYLWTQVTASDLRRREFHDLDIEHLAEEIQDLGRNDKREIKNRAAILMAHLLKWEFQSDKRSTSWRATITAQRNNILDLIEHSPSLKRELPGVIPGAYLNAVEQATAETGLVRDTTFPSTCPYTIEQLLDRSFYPGGLP